ncbi:type II toxin-antitoxin system VapC family toxin [Actinomyces capricornis]|uniref:Ribonuclease VapC n=1 Tax=Actinomyces capricornis TaxID=2755559 RepID=A0ABM7UF06_9ACTO|nr:type II toxin-antitoxin system VapC family toxin [Actinomyces capricornis]BDA65700.1 ribonuclease VapC [Actinomyces capricornis]
MIILDTNVISELAKATPDSNVYSWLKSCAPGEVGLTAISMQELWVGVLLLPDGRHRQDLIEFITYVEEVYSTVLCPFTLDAAKMTARVLARRRVIGRPISIADAQIAGTCLSGGHILATRNVRDFAGVAGLQVLDPFVIEPRPIDAAAQTQFHSRNGSADA